MDRRTALAAFSTVASHAMFGRVVEAWAQAPAAPWQPRAIPAAAGAQLAALVDAILPETDTPGARAAGVHVFVDLAVAECLEPADCEAFTRGLAALNAACRRDHGVDLDAAAPADVTALLRRAEGGRDPFVKTLKGLTVLGFGSSEIGARRALAYDPVPGRYRGCVDLAPGQRTWAER
jgi:hypothetical protein